MVKKAFNPVVAIFPCAEAPVSGLIGVGGGARLGEGWVAAKIDLSIAIGPTEETSARCLLHSGLTRVPQAGKAHDMDRDCMDDGNDPGRMSSEEINALYEAAASEPLPEDSGRVEV